VLFLIFSLRSETRKWFIINLSITIICVTLIVIYKVNHTPSVTNPRIEEVKAECETKIKYENLIQK
jgi:hypothetical protein